MTHGKAEATFTVAGGVGAPRTVRSLIRPHVGPHLGDEQLYDVELLVAEVVTNAVRHGGADEHAALTVDLRILADRIRIEVSDPGPGFERPRRPVSRPSGGGNGFVLLEQIASAWGVSRAGRTCVWLEYRLAPG